MKKLLVLGATLVATLVLAGSALADGNSVSMRCVSSPNAAQRPMYPTAD
jgi:hypothetical protein